MWEVGTVSWILVGIICALAVIVVKNKAQQIIIVLFIGHLRAQVPAQNRELLSSYSRG
jgi:hypothetical protein